MNEEIWKDVVGYEGLYQVSNLGNVKRLRFINGKYNFEKVTICKQQMRGRYLTTRLCKNGTIKRYSIHRLVAQAFPEICGKWFENCEVDHLDTITTNNIATNLKVCTRKENINNPITLKNIKNNSGLKTRFKKGVRYNDENRFNCTI